MIIIQTKNTKILYQAYHMAKAFFPGEEVLQELTHEQESFVCIQCGDSCFSIPSPCSKDDATRQIYHYYSTISGKTLPWGILTGVRPTKLFYDKLQQGFTTEDIISDLQNRYVISTEKAELSVSITQLEHHILSSIPASKGVSLYIGIPFCPSICSYCSFASVSLKEQKFREDQTGKYELVERYLDALCDELSVLSMQQDILIHTIYIGGGTPTSLSVEQLHRLLTQICNSVPMQHVMEFTVEAGRPDTITLEKLEVLRLFPVTRIAINPQSMNQITLDRIGRSHSTQQIVEAFTMARSVGFDSINMDIIAGLPGETVEDFIHTLSAIKELKPDGLTVHTLAMKRASQLSRKEQADVYQASCEEVETMLGHAAILASELLMKPYYLYRQKNIAGNFENVGYATVDKVCRYNILIMEDIQTILAFGAGAMTKYILPEKILIGDRSTHIIRESNPRDVYEYIRQIEVIKERKSAGMLQYVHPPNP